MDILNISAQTKRVWQKDMLGKGTPVARRWADYRMKKGELFEDFEDEYMEVVFLEENLYKSMKETLCHHIRLHGLDYKSQPFFENFSLVEHFNRHVYISKILKPLRRTFVKDETNRYLEYLISKITEYLNKVNDIGGTIFEMLVQGKKPDLTVWSREAAIQDALFEEQKQYLKQTLNHIVALERFNYKLGVKELRLLLYGQVGCRRQKLYFEVETKIMTIFYSLNEEEKTEMYKEICQFISEVVPRIGYISPRMISFIFDHGFLSKTTRDLLVKIHPCISSLCMVSLLQRSLMRYYEDMCDALLFDKINQTGVYTMELMELYFPKLVDANVRKRFYDLLESA